MAGGIDRWAAGGVAAVALGVYSRTLLPGIGYSGDVAKWQTISVVGGVPHPTGYPLYVALIQAFGSLFPFGTPAWRANLFSAVCAALAVALLYRLLRLLDVRWPVAVAVALTFAFTRLFWIQAVVAEVYTLHLLLLVAVFTCLARWRGGGGNGLLLAAMALLALSIGNHLTTVLALPGVMWLMWSDRRRALTRTNLLAAAGFAVLGLSQYLYLIYMTEVGGYVEFPVHNLGDVASIISGGSFKDQLFAFSVGELLTDRLPMLWEVLREEFLVLLVPIAFGLWRIRSRPAPQRDVLVALALLGLGSAFYGINYAVVDVIVYFLPLFLVLAVFLAVGVDEAVTWAQARLPALASRRLVSSGAVRRRLVSSGAVGALVALPLVTGVVDYPRSSQRGNVPTAQRIESALDGISGHAVLLSEHYDDSEFLWYYLLGEGVGAERQLVLVHTPTVAQVKDYFAGRPGLIATAAGQLVGTEDPPLLVISATQAAAMEDAGLKVVEVAPGIWRIKGVNRRA